MLPEASRGVIRLRPELPVWRRWEPGPVGSTGGGTHISVLAGGASSSGAAGGGSPTGRLIPPCPSGRLLCSLFFSSFSCFLSPMLSRPVTKVVSCPEPCPSQLAFSCSSQPLLCPAHIQDLSQAGSSVVGCETSALVSDSPDLNLRLPASSWVTPASYLTSPGLSFLICEMETATSIF